MNKKSYRWTNPICNCLNCKYNLHNVCTRDGASECVGYKCPHFTPSFINVCENATDKPGAIYYSFVGEFYCFN